jgi:hypothetical protein
MAANAQASTSRDGANATTNDTFDEEACSFKPISKLEVKSMI